MAALLVALYLAFAPIDFAIEPGQTTYVRGVLSGNGVVTNAHLHLQVAPGVQLRSADVGDWNCTTSGNTLDCTKAVFDSAAGQQFSLSIEAPADLNGGTFPVSGTLTANENAHGVDWQNTVRVRHHITVQSSADSGEGTLRAAIDAANRDCATMPDCVFDFDLPQPATIDLAAPLPAITAPAFIMNADVEFSGKRLKSGSGLVVRPVDAVYPGVRLIQLKIHDFPGNGIDYAGSTPNIGSSLQILHCVVESNGLRGVSVNAPDTSADFMENTIGHNGRSGVALWQVRDGSFYGNTIEWNGAAGIYVGGSRDHVAVSQGVIAFNEIGVAINSKSAAAAVVGASMAENIADDLDWGIDGNNGPDAESGPSIPVLLNASYDTASNTTTVGGKIHGTFGQWASIGIVLYASDHATRWGNTPMTNAVSQIVSATRVTGADGFSFIMTFRGDYRGTFLSAQSTYQMFADYPVSAASEIGPAIQVPR